MTPGRAATVATSANWSVVGLSPNDAGADGTFLPSAFGCVDTPTQKVRNRHEISAHARRSLIKGGAVLWNPRSRVPHSSCGRMPWSLAGDR